MDIDEKAAGGEGNPFEVLSKKLVGERKRAIEAREGSGLDEIWRKARLMFNGVDPALADSDEYTKPGTLDSGLLPPVSTNPERRERSTMVMNITRPYVDNAAAWVTGIVLPTGKRQPWSLKLTPEGELALIERLVAKAPILVDLMSEELRERYDAWVSSETPREAALERAQTYLEDALNETRWTSELRQVIHEAAMVGTGVMKGPVGRNKELSPEVRDFIELVLSDPGEYAAVQADALEAKLMFLAQPAGEQVPVENLYPDPGCGGRLADGEYVWEKEPNQNEADLLELVDDEGYFGEQIKYELRRCRTDRQRGQGGKELTLWHRVGRVSYEMVEDLEWDEEEDEEEDLVPRPEYVWRQITMLNDRVIRVAPMPLDLEQLPYHALCWSTRVDSWAGIGVAEQLESVQRAVTAAVRSGSDNMAMSVGFMLGVRRGVIEPAKGDDYSLRPYKVFYAKTDGMNDLSGSNLRVDDALKVFEFPNHLDRILAWINYLNASAEVVSGMPRVMQGHADTSSVGVTEQQVNSATASLKLLVNRLDADVIKPFIEAAYRWVQTYGPAKARGDAAIDGVGSSVLVMTDLQTQMVMQLLPLADDPAMKISKKKLVDMLLEASQIEPGEVRLTEEEAAELRELMAQPDPKVESTQIKAQSDMQIAQMRSQVDMLRAEIERMKIALEAEKAAAANETKMDVTETQVAGNIASAAVNGGGQPEGPSPGQAQPPQELSTDQALDMMGIRGG